MLWCGIPFSGMSIALPPSRVWLFESKIWLLGTIVLIISILAGQRLFILVGLWFFLQGMLSYLYLVLTRSYFSSDEEFEGWYGKETRHRFGMEVVIGIINFFIILAVSMVI